MRLFVVFHFLVMGILRFRCAREVDGSMVDVIGGESAANWLFAGVNQRRSREAVRGGKGEFGSMDSVLDIGLAADIALDVRRGELVFSVDFILGCGSLCAAFGLACARYVGRVVAG